MIPGISASRSGAYTLPIGDPFWNFVDVMINFTGVDGSSSFVDAKGHTITPYGSPVIRTDMYPAGAIMFTGEEYLRVDGLAPFGTGDFTIEMYFENLVSPSSERGHFQVSSDPSGLQPSYANAVTSLASGAGPSVFNAIFDGTSLTAPFVSGMAHICIQRKLGVVQCFANGVLGSSDVDAFGYTGTVLAIGAYYALGGRAIGPCQAFRVTTGVARYADSFTPPELPFPSY